MSEEIKLEAPAEAPKAKQYLLMVDELNMALLSKVMPNIQFIQVEGMGMQNNSTHMLLVNPLPKITPVTQPVEAAKVEERID